MKVLYISNKPVFPSVDGGCVAMRQFLNCLLHTGTEVRHIAFSTHKHPFKVEAYPETIRQKIHPEGINLDTRITFFRALPYLYKRSSFNVDRFYSPEVVRRIRHILTTESFDCIILESLFCTPYLDDIRSVFPGKIVVRTHNVEYRIWQDLAHHTPLPLKRWFLKKLARDLQRYEISALRRVDGLLPITSEDEEAFRSDGILTKAHTIPVTLSVDNRSPEPSAAFFHLGAMDWGPNEEAVRRLLDILPEIQSRLPEAELRIAGKCAKKVLGEVHMKGVTVDDFVEDLQTFLHNSGILVSPVTSGSGVRIKLLEAMAAGVPVITTRKGALGIRAAETRPLIIADSDNELIDACVRLYSDASLRKEIARNGQNYMLKNHNIDTVSPELLEFLERT